MARFADFNVSQGSVATYARCYWIFDTHLTANLARNLPVKKKFLNRFLAHPVYVTYIESDS